MNSCAHFPIDGRKYHGKFGIWRTLHGVKSTSHCFMIYIIPHSFSTNSSMIQPYSVCTHLASPTLSIFIRHRGWVWCWWASAAFSVCSMVGFTGNEWVHHIVCCHNRSRRPVTQGGSRCSSYLFSLDLSGTFVVSSIDLCALFLHCRRWSAKNCCTRWF